MANAAYQKGMRREYQVMDLLRKEGWYPLRSAGSHGLFDIVAWHPHSVYTRWIQVKSYAISNRERKEFQELIGRRPANCVFELWEFVGRCKEPRVTA